MIRVRLKETIYCVKKLHSYPALGRIIFYDKDDKYEITLESSQKVEELMSQACERGFIDFTKENIEVEFY